LIALPGKETEMAKRKKRKTKKAREKFKAMKRHLRASYGMNPAKWDFTSSGARRLKKLLKPKVSVYSRLMKKHDRCVEVAQLYATCMRGEDSKRAMWRSLQEKELIFARALKRAVRERRR
jgi:hypothetical protein